VIDLLENIGVKKKLMSDVKQQEKKIKKLPEWLRHYGDKFFSSKDCHIWISIKD
jgi:hypothetical protein